MENIEARNVEMENVGARNVEMENVGNINIININIQNIKNLLNNIASDYLLYLQYNNQISMNLSNLYKDYIYNNSILNIEADKYNNIIDLLIYIGDFFYAINKQNRNSFKYFKNNSALYYLIIVMIYHTKFVNSYVNFENIKNSILNNKININTLLGHIDENIRLARINENIGFAVNKIIRKFTSSRNCVITDKLVQIKHNIDLNFNQNDNYSLNDFFLAFIINYININDSNKFIAKTIIDQDFNLIPNHYPLNIPIHDQYQREILIYRNKTIFESGLFAYLLQYPTNYKLTLIILIKCKHIICTKPFSNEVYINNIIRDRNYLLLLYNAIATFEKHKRKFNNFHHRCDYYYNFDDIKQYYDTLNVNFNSKTTLIKNFVNDLLRNNQNDHHFSKLYVNHRIIANVGLRLNRILRFYYNKYYISLKKVYRFVKDFNNVVFFNNIIFNNITTDDIIKFCNTETKSIYYFLSRFGDNFYVFKYSPSNDEINVLRQLQWDIPQNNRDLVYPISPKTFYCDTWYNIINKNDDYCKNPFHLSIETDATYQNVRLKFNYFFNVISLICNNNYIIHNGELRFNRLLSVDEIRNSRFRTRDFNNKNILININIIIDAEHSHNISVNININKRYIDIYDSSFINSLHNYANVLQYIKTYFTNDFRLLNDNAEQIIFTLYSYAAHMQTQLENEESFKNYCITWNHIYCLMRIYYFNDSCYSMNYIQQLINEYIMSFNHPLYFLFNWILFIFLVYASMHNRDILRIRSMNEYEHQNRIIGYHLSMPLINENNRFVYKIDYLRNPVTDFYRTLRSTIINTDKLNVICRNYNRIFNNQLFANLEQIQPTTAEQNNAIQNELFRI